MTSGTPNLTYVSQKVQNVTATYADLPGNTEIVFVNQTSGAASDGTLLDAGGSGSVTLDIAPDLPAGGYHLLARDRSSKQFIAQTVPFYHSEPAL